MKSSCVVAEQSFEVNPFFAADPEPFVNVFAPDSNSEASSSGVITTTEPNQSTQPHEHLRKWTDSHPIDNIIGNPSRPVSTRKQLATDALCCFYNSVLSKVELKNFNSTITEDCWFQAMQDEIHEFDRLVYGICATSDCAYDYCYQVDLYSNGGHLRSIQNSKVISSTEAEYIADVWMLCSKHMDEGSHYGLWLCIQSHPLLSTGVATDRFIYWIAYVITDAYEGEFRYKYFLILSFDMITHEFKEVHLSDSIAKQAPRNIFISMLNESLIVSAYTNVVNDGRVYGVWMMGEEGGVMTSFTKLFNIKTPHDSSIRMLFGFTKSSEPIIETVTEYLRFTKINVYESCSKHINDLGIARIIGSFFICPCTETLLLLDHLDGSATVRIPASIRRLPKNLLDRVSQLR
ncbi:hypothetical protein Tco_0617204 [Tanacetum coccineum]